MPLEYALQFNGKFAPASPWKFPPAFPAKLEKKLGIQDIPQQKVRRFKQKPFKFNIMVIGESGLGKTTFMNTLFSTDLENVKPRDLLVDSTVKITPHDFSLEENGVTLHLTVVDTPGFGDSLNREDNVKPILDYIMEKYEGYFNNELSNDNRQMINDERVHAALYFVSPTGSGLKHLDIYCLQQLCGWINVIPLIAKADSLTREEITKQKQAFLRDAERFNLQFYPNSWSSDLEQLGPLTGVLPYAVIGSESLFSDGANRMVRARRYRWGLVEVDNPEHCDFVHLRAMLLQHSLLDLVSTTHQIHFSKFRVHRLGSPDRRESVLACDDAYEDRIQQSRTALLQEMVKKEDEMRRTFVAKVKEKEMVLREQEENLRSIRDQLAEEIEQLKASIEEERVEVEELLKHNSNAAASAPSNISKKK